MSTDSGQPAIGVSTADFKYGNQTDDIIPAGSLIFTGTYKGNPAYNLVVLYDTEGNVIGEKDGNVLRSRSSSPMFLNTEILARLPPEPGYIM